MSDDCDKNENSILKAVKNISYQLNIFMLPTCFATLAIRILFLVYLIMIYNLLNSMKIYDFNILSNSNSLVNGTYRMFRHDKNVWRL